MTFALSWLDLREGADHAARHPKLLAAAAEYLGAAEAPLAVDLGAGSGSTMRAFGCRAPQGTRWRLVDRDRDLLGVAESRSDRAVEICVADLAAVEALPLEGARLVTASALFDLVSAAWIGRLVERLVAERVGLYAALNYDGRMDWRPECPGDDPMLRAFNAHQRRDKGFGSALGPDAASALAAALARCGYRVELAASPWRLAPDQGALQAALAEGVAQAATEAGGAGAGEWGQARRAAAMAGLSSCTVSHADLLALPA